MKYFIYTIIFLAIVFIGISVPATNLSNFMEGDSGNALIVIVGSLCVIVLMSILLISRVIAEKHK